MTWWWSYLLTAVGVTGLYLAGRKSPWGWALGLGAQGLWLAYALVTEQYGFIVSSVAYGWVFGLNLYRNTAWGAVGKWLKTAIQGASSNSAQFR